ncbi:hypothetical protein [Mycobacterium hubeiense]|uniref:hypothetical protein n=1 Tax=Mycobacterium hubeiense TaxID=1867256 RepID=UPI001E4E43F2|nr:hypothetical protein [Mycobacterium sp. QGD 101]
MQRLLDELDARDRILLSARVWTATPQSLATVAERLGVHTVWIHRNQPRAEARFAELIAAPTHREVANHAAELSRRLGPYVPADTVAAELCRLDIDPASEAAQVLLYLAGPYVRRGGWLENTTSGGHQQVSAAVDSVFDRCAAPSGASLAQALAGVGMAPDVADAYLDDQVALRRFGELWVRWSGSTADKVASVLHARGTPAAPDDIAATIGDTSLRAVQDALYADYRFTRASRQTWALREWGLDEYSGIYDEITARIEASGGQVRVSELVHDLVSRFPDVAESSIRVYLNTLAFITEAEMVRLRTDADEWPPVGPLHTARGAFRNGHNELRLAVTVTTEVVRGSSRPIHPAVATALGINPGQRRLFTSPQGPVAVTWRLSSTNGPNIGSLRQLAIATAAALTNTLVLTFRLDEASLEVARIDPEATGIQRLRQLLGCPLHNPVAAMAASLDCRPADVTKLLRGRGDQDLANLLQDLQGQA